MGKVQKVKRRKPPLPKSKPAWMDEAARAILLHLKMPERDFEESVMQVTAIIERHCK